MVAFHLLFSLFKVNSLRIFGNVFWSYASPSSNSTKTASPCLPTQHSTSLPEDPSCPTCAAICFWMCDFLLPGATLLKRTYFPLSSCDQLFVSPTSQCSEPLFVLASLRAETASGLSLLPAFTTAARSHVQLLGDSPCLLSTLVIHHLWLLHSSCTFFGSDSWAMGRGGVT